MDDLLNVRTNERVDLADFDFMSDESRQRTERLLFSSFMLDPAAPMRVVSGFAMDNPSGTQVRVTKGIAVLGQREGALTFNSLLTVEGDATKIVDVGSFSAGTYGIFVRFEFVDGDQLARTFWNPSGNGSEFSQTIPTRRQANWSMRIETSSPGAEWFKIGETTEAAAITDQRDFYFEGDIAGGTIYEPGWSSDGGGIADDRNADRQQFGVFDFQTFTAAMRQCIEDIKGRGLRRWWERDIGGINVGFDADPVEDRIAVGDVNCNILNDGSVITRLMETGSFWRYTRGTNLFELVSLGGIDLTAGGAFDVTSVGGSLDVGTGALPITANGGVTVDSSGGTARALLATGNATRPALGLVAKAAGADPTIPAKGDIWPLTTTGRMSVYNGTAIERMYSNASAQTNGVAGDRRTTTGLFATDYTSPANSLRIGSVIRIRVGLRNVSGTGTLSTQVNFDSLPMISSSLNPAVGEYLVFDITVILTTATDFLLNVASMLSTSGGQGDAETGQFTGGGFSLTATHLWDVEITGLSGNTVDLHHFLFDAT